MHDKIKEVLNRHKKLEELLNDPEVIARQKEWQKHAKAHASLSTIVNTHQDLKETEEELKQAKSLLAEQKDDQEMKEFLQEEITSLSERQEEKKEELKLLLLPKDPRDEKNVVMEIRSGAGGDEAALFVASLYRMYARYAEKQGWKVDILSSNPTELGGFKEMVFVVEGHGAFSHLKFEMGVHRVQRIPTTESGGRIHTSTVTVAVLPEAEEVEVDIDPNELRVDLFCSSGPGGQSVNTTHSAVRITHEPTGLVVSCQDEKSQHKNKEKALRVLRARLLDAAEAENHAEMAEARRLQVGTGDRSERIRTYNYPQGRVTDHRIGLTLHKLEEVLEGDIDSFIEELISADQAERLKKVE